jgi:hypothetical protein
MKEMIKNNSGVDWALVGSILFWIIVIVTFTTLISSGKTRIPNPILEVTEASASRGNIIIAHRNGDPARFANTRCMWTPDISSPNVTKEAGSLVMVGNEIKQGRVSKLEPGEMAKLEKNINMKEGSVGRIIIIDLMSGQQIFSQTVKVTE